MKAFVLLAVAIGVAQAVSLAAEPRDEDWEAFKAKYGKTYANDVEERFRKMIFMENLQQIEEHNKGISTYKLGINKFSDMLPSEFAAIMHGHRPSGTDGTLSAQATLLSSNL